MDASLEKLKAKIAMLIAHQEQMEEKYITSVAHLVKDVTKKGFDLPLLTGMILNVNEVITKLPANMEVWQAAGQKFLLKAKNQNFKSKKTRSKT